MSQSPEKTIPKWHHPTEVMKLFKLKQRRKNANPKHRPNQTVSSASPTTASFESVLTAQKRKNPFLKETNCKRSKTEAVILTESSDQTIFKLLHGNVSSSSAGAKYTSFNNVLSQINKEELKEPVEIVKAKGERWLPIDWSLKHRVRLMSAKPFPWNQTVKNTEQAEGIAAFTRCETECSSSPTANFQRCCLFWQTPYLPWLNLFPRSNMKLNSTGNNIALNSAVKESIQNAWSDSLRSLYNSFKTRHCPYFYVCANSFTVLFRGAGMCGFEDDHVLITPTTRGFRQLLKKEDIDYTMPLKKKRLSDLGYETDSMVSEQTLDGDQELIDDEDDAFDEEWLKSMGISAEDIKQINYTQEKIIHRAECEVDNSEQSLVVIEGVAVHALYNFLINCKSAIAITGPLAGIPPTLLSPVAFLGASLNSLKVRTNKMNIDGCIYYCVELSGPILPTTSHNLFAVNLPENSISMTFNSVTSTDPFSKVQNKGKPKTDEKDEQCAVFRKINLTDSGILPEVLKHFCSANGKYVTNVECLKYSSDNKTFTWS